MRKPPLFLFTSHISHCPLDTMMDLLTNPSSTDRCVNGLILTGFYQQARQKALVQVELVNSGI